MSAIDWTCKKLEGSWISVSSASLSLEVSLGRCYDVLRLVS
jgi:hypothetical protein